MSRAAGFSRSVVSAARPRPSIRGVAAHIASKYEGKIASSKDMARVFREIAYAARADTEGMFRDIPRGPGTEDIAKAVEAQNERAMQLFNSYVERRIDSANLFRGEKSGIESPDDGIVNRDLIEKWLDYADREVSAAGTGGRSRREIDSVRFFDVNELSEIMEFDGIKKAEARSIAVRIVAEEEAGKKTGTVNGRKESAWLSDVLFPSRIDWEGGNSVVSDSIPFRPSKPFGRMDAKDITTNITERLEWLTSVYGDQSFLPRLYQVLVSNVEKQLDGHPELGKSVRVQLGSVVDSYPKPPRGESGSEKAPVAKGGKHKYAEQVLNNVGLIMYGVPEMVVGPRSVTNTVSLKGGGKGQHLDPVLYYTPLAPDYKKTHQGVENVDMLFSQLDDFAMMAMYHGSNAKGTTAARIDSISAGTMNEPTVMRSWKGRQKIERFGNKEYRGDWIDISPEDRQIVWHELMKAEPDMAILGQYDLNTQRLMSFYNHAKSKKPEYYHQPRSWPGFFQRAGAFAGDTDPAVKKAVIAGRVAQVVLRSQEEVTRGSLMSVDSDRFVSMTGRSMYDMMNDPSEVSLTGRNEPWFDNFILAVSEGLKYSLRSIKDAAIGRFGAKDKYAALLEKFELKGMSLREINEVLMREVGFSDEAEGLRSLFMQMFRVGVIENFKNRGILRAYGRFSVAQGGESRGNLFGHVTATRPDGESARVPRRGEVTMTREEFMDRRFGEGLLIGDRDNLARLELESAAATEEAPVFERNAFGIISELNSWYLENRGVIESSALGYFDNAVLATRSDIAEIRKLNIIAGDQSDHPSMVALEQTMISLQEMQASRHGNLDDAEKAAIRATGMGGKGLEFTATGVRELQVDMVSPRNYTDDPDLLYLLESIRDEYENVHFVAESPASSYAQFKNELGGSPVGSERSLQMARENVQKILDNESRNMDLDWQQMGAGSPDPYARKRFIVNRYASSMDHLAEFRLYVRDQEMVSTRQTANNVRIQAEEFYRYAEDYAAIREQTGTAPHVWRSMSDEEYAHSVIFGPKKTEIVKKEVVGKDGEVTVVRETREVAEEAFPGLDSDDIDRVIAETRKIYQREIATVMENIAKGGRREAMTMVMGNYLDSIGLKLEVSDMESLVRALYGIATEMDATKAYVKAFELSERLGMRPSDIVPSKAMRDMDKQITLYQRAPLEGDEGFDSFYQRTVEHFREATPWKVEADVLITPEIAFGMWLRKADRAGIKRDAIIAETKKFAESSYPKGLPVEKYFPPLYEGGTGKPMGSFVRSAKYRIAKGIKRMMAEEKRQEKVSKAGYGPAYRSLPNRDPASPTKTYAGIGSRETPAKLRPIMAEIAKQLEAKGYKLRTGDAKGADSYFASGSKNAERFSVRDWESSNHKDRTTQIAKEVHPLGEGFDNLGEFVKGLHSRNAFQIFGKDLDTPADFVLAWTKDGVESAGKTTRDTGGSGQSIRLAEGKGIPVINISKEGWVKKLSEVLGEELDETALRSSVEPVREAKVAVPEAKVAVPKALPDLPEGLKGSNVGNEELKIVRLDQESQYSREMAEANPDIIFVYAENMYGTSGRTPIGGGKHRPIETSDVISGLPNAKPITVMLYWGRNLKRKSNLVRGKEVRVADVWAKELEEIRTLAKTKTVILPTGKIGQGPKAHLSEALQKNLDLMLMETLGVDNDG